MKIGIAIICTALAGCATTEGPQVVYKAVEAKTIVKVPCLAQEQVPVEPKYELDDPAVAKKTFDEKGAAALREIEQRRKWQRDAKALLEGCVAPSK